MGNPDNPSYIPTVGTSFSDQMSFSERLMNVVTNVAMKIMFSVADRIVTEGYVHKHIGNDVPPLSDIARNTSLLLVDTHFSLDRPRPLVPGIVEVGRTPPQASKEASEGMTHVQFFRAYDKY
jgi:glucuronosyltransferase